MTKIVNNGEGRPIFVTTRGFAGRKYALVLAPNVETRHIKNVTRSVGTFTALGYSEIHVVWPDPENIPASSTEQNSSTIAKYDNRSSSVGSALADISKRFEPSQDALTLYITGHGSPDPSIRFDDGFVDAGDISIEVATLQRPSGIVISDQCYGFNFALPFVDNFDWSGISASESRRPSYKETFPTAYFRALEISGHFRESFLLSYKDSRLTDCDEKQYPQFITPGATGPLIEPDFLEESHDWVPSREIQLAARSLNTSTLDHCLITPLS